MACECGCHHLTTDQFLDLLEAEMEVVDESGRTVAPAQHEAPLQAGFHYRTICAWCQTVTEQGTPGAEVSHGICALCEARVS